MRMDPLQRKPIPTAVARVTRSRPYVDYKLQEEHDALLHAGADKQDERRAASEAAQAITALISQLSELNGTIAQGLAPLQHRRKHNPQVEASLTAAFHREFDATLRLFDEYPSLRQSWKQVLTSSFESASSNLFDIHGPAAAVQKVIKQIERTTASMLIEPQLLSRMLGSIGYSYSPHTRLRSYSTMIHSLSLLIHRQG
ncbi:hypothetical protein PCCS19_24980 [Paenibacillus sp. CCS19]|uniref:hypothetical protein n=1 Tax=Paenibacillus sp. CCS19 TaxID=3158387 RepID=UPI002563D87F|nr:hypothetical protein [Paenibacillus cellulosilyticus]GMK39444.1 hypothetical protein PCCS19_24980 [Paenibacillus cellulosilyticus]